MRMNRSENARLRGLADYLAATGNEIAVDRAFLALAGLTPARAGYLPRSPKWIGFGRRHPAATRALWAVLWAVWLAGGAALFFLRQMLPLWRAARHPAPLPARAAQGGAVFALSSRTGDLLTARQFPDLPQVWYTLPWAPLRAVPADSIRVDLLALLSRAELWQAYRDALRAGLVVARRAGTRRWLLQTYTAFQWFAVRTALLKVPRRLVMAGHYDRWTVLADAAAREFRGRGDGAGELVQIQHGSLAALGDDPAAQLHLARRLRQVTHLYVFNADAEHAFKAVVHSPRCARALHVSHFKLSIELAGERHSAHFRIMFVGHAMCEQLHASIYRALPRGMQAYYKPHPLAPMADALRGLGWTVIDDKNHFPAVDLLVGYESTLVAEYAGHGIAAIVHPINLGSAHGSEIAAQVAAHHAAHGARAAG